MMIFRYFGFVVWLVAALFIGCRPKASAPEDSKKPPVDGSLRVADGEPLANLALIRSGISGESHSRALDALMEVSKNGKILTGADMQTLVAFINTSKPGDLTLGEWEERVNVVLNVLRSQKAYVPGLTDYLLTTSENNPSRILRLYAMQHLALWYSREPSEEKRREMVDLLETLAEKPGEETAGSAVLFLNDLQHDAAITGGEVVKDEVIGRAALRLAGDSSAKQDVRISALHVCVERRMTDVLPAARQIAADMSAVIPLRKAAIFSIGQLGGAVDQALLDKLSLDTPDLRPATAPALAKLRSLPN